MSWFRRHLRKMSGEPRPIHDRRMPRQHRSPRERRPVVGAHTHIGKQLLGRSQVPTTQFAVFTKPGTRKPKRYGTEFRRPRT